MIGAEEYENFVGGDPAGEDNYPLEPCRRCNDYPCRCVRDEIER